MKMTTLTTNDGDGALSPLVWSCVHCSTFLCVVLCQLHGTWIEGREEWMSAVGHLGSRPR